MQLHLGKEKVRLILDGNFFKVCLPFVISTPTNNNYLKSVDNYILTDLNGVYLIPKEGE